MAAAHSYEAPSFATNPANQMQQAEEEEEGERSSLQRTIGNVMNLLNDGLYRIKNRTKSE